MIIKLISFIGLLNCSICAYRNILTDTPLHSAAGKGSEECLKCLIVNGADVNARLVIYFSSSLVVSWSELMCIITLVYVKKHPFTLTIRYSECNTHYCFKTIKGDIPHCNSVL